MTHVMIVGGENPVFIKHKVEEIKSQFSEDAVISYYSDDLNVTQFLSELDSFSLFASKRLIILKNAESISGSLENSLITYFENPSESICLLLHYQSSISQKIKTASAKHKICVYEFKKVWPNELKSYVRKSLINLDIQADDSVVQTLVDLSGSDISEVSGMIEHLSRFLGDRKILTDEDLEIVLDRVKNSSIFQFLEAIFQHNVASALTALNDLLYAGNSLHAINAMFYRSIKIMWAVKTIKSQSVPPNLSISPYEWKKYQAFAKKNTLRFLSRCLEAVRTIEIASKTKTEDIAHLIFEDFLCQIK